MADWISTNRIKQQLTFDLDFDENVILQTILDSCLTFVKRETGQQLVSGTYKMVAPSGNRLFQLKERPVNRILRVSTPLPALTVACAGVRPLVSVTDDALILSQFVTGTVREDTIAFDTYATLQDVAIQIATIPNWSATVSGDMGPFPSDDLEPCGGQPGKSITLLSYSHDVAYDRRGATIVLPFVPCFGQVQVKYTAGFDTCPDDLAQVLARMCQFEFAAREADGVYSSENLGGYAYTLNPQRAFESLGGWAKDVLESYRIDRLVGANVVA